MSYCTANLQMLHFIYLFNKYTYWIFWTCCTLSVFSSSKCRLFHNATFFGSCIIHILNTGVLKFKRKFRRQKLIIFPHILYSTEQVAWDVRTVTYCKIRVLMRRTRREREITCTRIYSGLSTESGHLEQRQLKESTNSSKTKRNMYDTRTSCVPHSKHSTLRI